jgi:hypothetical protein
LGENFAVHLGDEIVFAVVVLAPDLPELNRLDRHAGSSTFRDLLQTT